tara:strand:+ start:32 stop:334 length:303 start_codon:yes stop_codon:yes gene_type:complete
MITSHNTEIDIIDFIDLLDTTLSPSFAEKWRHKYSEKFIKLFQAKILHSVSNRKPLKLDNLYTYLTKKCKYSKEQVLDFFKSIEIDLYSPLISGKLTKAS